MGFLNKVEDDTTIKQSINNNSNTEFAPSKEQILAKFAQYTNDKTAPVFSLQELENLSIGGKKLVRDTHTSTDDWELKVVPFDSMDKYLIASLEVKSKFFQAENKVSKFIKASFRPLLVDDGSAFIADPITWKMNWKSPLQVGDKATIQDRCWGYLINKKTNQMVTSII